MEDVSHHLTPEFYYRIVALATLPPADKPLKFTNYNLDYAFQIALSMQIVVTGSLYRSCDPSCSHKYNTFCNLCQREGHVATEEVGPQMVTLLNRSMTKNRVYLQWDV